MNSERDKGLSKQGRKNYDDIEWNSRKATEPLSEESLARVANEFKGSPIFTLEHKESNEA